MNRRSFLVALGIAPVAVTVRAVGEAAVTVSGPEMIIRRKLESGFAEIATSQAETVRAILDARRHGVSV